jgi:hypothetical protein
LAAVQESYAEARMRGLCHEGAWEYALGVVRTLDMRSFLTRLRQEDDGGDLRSVAQLADRAEA